MDGMSPSATRTTTIDLAHLADGIRSGDRAMLARAITLIESKRANYLAKSTFCCDA